MPKQLNSRCKELVASLIEYFERERDNDGPLLPLTAVRERVAAALNIGLNTVSKVSQAVKKNEVLKSPPKKRSGKKRVTNTNVLNVDGIREVIYQMYETRQDVTLDSLLVKLQEKQLFDGCRRSLSNLLKEIGFKWKKDEPRRGLMERSDVAVKRVQFLRNHIKQKEAALYKFVYIDETWIFQNGTISRSWQNNDKRSVKTTKVDGKRYIVLHAGNEDGFIEGAEAIFCSKTKLSDYHREMNQENFLKWFENQLLKNLPEPSLIVMDNAPYHSVLLYKTPNTNWNKNQIKEWLTNKSIAFTDNMLKVELLNIVARNKPPVQYLVDHIAEQYGHKVLRLPPYHCNFNPIELIWGISKQYYNKHIGRDGTTGEDSLNMWSEALRTITPEIWKSSINHTEKEISKWFDRERMLDTLEITPIIIHLTNEESSEETGNSIVMIPNKI